MISTKKNRSIFSTAGFTLVELLLYSVLIGVVVLAASAVLTILQRQMIRSQVIREVEEQGTAAMQIITQTIRNSTGITSPTTGASGSSLTLTVSSGGLSPTVFDLSSGVLRVTEGVGSPVSLTSGKVTVSSLTFNNYSRVSTPGTVRITFTVGYNTTGAPAEYTFSKTFISNASRR